MLNLTHGSYVHTNTVLMCTIDIRIRTCIAIYCEHTYVHRNIKVAQNYSCMA